MEIEVVGCGWEGRRASEDEAAAGAILRRLRQRGVRLGGRARRVVDLYLNRLRRALMNITALPGGLSAWGTRPTSTSASPKTPWT